MTDYRTAVTRQTRVTSRVLHVTEVVRGRKWIESRHGSALCGVPVTNFPESGDEGKPENATCPRCRARYRKITEA